MKALVKLEKGVGHVELKTDWPKPAVKQGWVLVEVFGCGICGTDLHILEDTHKNWPPVVLGHEYTGRIVEVASDVTNWKVGDRVVCEQHTLACLTCDACRRGAIHLCQAKRSPGWGIDGAFADFVTLPANLLLPARFVRRDHHRRSSSCLLVDINASFSSASLLVG